MLPIGRRNAVSSMMAHSLSRPSVNRRCRSLRRMTCRSASLTGMSPTASTAAAYSWVCSRPGMNCGS